MAVGNTTLAIDKETRDRLNVFVEAYNAKKHPNEKELTAKNFIAVALDYFQRTGIDFNSDVVAVPTTTEPEQSKELSEVKEMFMALSKMYADTNLKVTAIGQGMQQGFESLGEVQKETRLLLESKATRTEKEEKDMETIHLKKLGEVLKYWRKKNGISVYELSQVTKINYHTLKGIEAGNKNVQLRTFLRYAWFINHKQHEFNLFGVYNIWHNSPDCTANMNMQEVEELKNDIEQVLAMPEPKEGNNF